MLSLFALATVALSQLPPTLWLIGDSTVRNGQGKGDGDQWGWGDCLGKFFDSEKLKVVNRAIGGRSSRTFLTEGRWETILSELRPGDFVMMQFGHNDPGAINDDSRARGSIRGIGDETEEIDNLLTKKHETVHTFGWYMSKYVREAKEHGATEIICSYVPRCPRPGDKVERHPEPSSYRLWAQQVAAREKAFYIDLYRLIWDSYVQETPEALKETYFTAADFTHTNRKGAEMNAGKVVEGIRSLAGCGLKGYLLP